MNDIDELERLAEVASHGEWGNPGVVREFQNAAAPDAILDLIAEVRRLRAENESLRLARLDGDSPRRAVTLELEMQADTPRDLASALYNFSIQIDHQEVSRSGVSGGCHAGYTYTYTANEAPSHDEYFAAVDVWLESRKAHPKEGV